MSIDANILTLSPYLEVWMFHKLDEIDILASEALPRESKK